MSFILQPWQLVFIVLAGWVNTIIQPGDEVGRRDGDIQCHERLGGLLRYYYRDAA